MTQVDELLAEIRTLEGTEVHLQTNAGTYGAAEACRKCGTGDPHFADRNVYDTPAAMASWKSTEPPSRVV